MILNNKLERRVRKKIRTRRKISGTPERPRLSVYRSLKHVYAQLVDDTTGTTLASASTRSTAFRDQLAGLQSRTEAAKLVGQFVAKQAVEKKITHVVFDRNGFLFHGLVKAVADGARDGGLKF